MPSSWPLVIPALLKERHQLWTRRVHVAVESRNCRGRGLVQLCEIAAHQIAGERAVTLGVDPAQNLCGAYGVL